MNDVEINCKWIELKLRPFEGEERKEYEELTYNNIPYDEAYIWDCELPNEGEEVLVTNGIWIAMDIFDYYDYWNCGFETYDADEITYWMRLPIPPQKNKKENV